MALLGNAQQASNILGQLGNTTVTTTGAIGDLYGQQSYPVASPQPIYYTPSVPVIPYNHGEPIHFQDKNGHVHSYNVSELFRLLGIEW